MTQDYDSLNIRSYQLMCIVCKIGAGLGSDLGDKRLNEILQQVRANPNMPVTLRCNVDSPFQYQNPGTSEDTPEGELFNVRRDLDILQKLGLVPGDTRPAIELFARLFQNISTSHDICGYDMVEPEIWKGCPDAKSGNYEKGHAQGIKAVFSGRSEEEMAKAKKESVAAIYQAEKLRLRPGHLMCLTCFHKGREKLEPIEEDNLFEIIDVIQQNPEIPITLERRYCMICPPCYLYDPECGLCFGGKIGAELRGQRKALVLLQRLGLNFGDTRPARELFTLLYERIPSTKGICAYGDGIVRAPEWSICGDPNGSPSYEKGRAAGLGFLD